MTDASDDAEVIEAAVRAKGLRAAGELTETNAAFDAIRAEVLERIVYTDPDQEPRKLDRLIAGIKIIDAVRNALKEAVAKGEQATNYRALLDQHFNGHGPRQGR